MKKSDLENGMIVEYENGERAIVIKYFCDNTPKFNYGRDFLIGLHLDGFMPLSEYNENLLLKGYDEFGYSIKKVGYPKSLGCDCKDEKNIKWLWERKEKPKIKLTDDERKLLEIAYNQSFKWIARNETGSLDFFKDKPIKEYHVWADQDGYWLETFDDMFEFIKWEDKEPYSIEELLKGE